MTQEPPKPGNDILQTLDQIDAYLVWAKEQVANNVEVDLAGLDYSIETACDIVRKSGQDVKDQAEPKITQIVKHLEELADNLRQHPMVAEEAGDDLNDSE